MKASRSLRENIGVDVKSQVSVAGLSWCEPWTSTMGGLAGLIFVIFLGLRLLTWSNTVLLEDYDSLGFLNSIAYILNGNVQTFYSDPDRQPGFPFFGALLSLPGWDTEIGARLTSLAFSILLFLALLGIGMRIGSPLQILFALLFLSISPVMISLSVAVLSEPTYTAILYLGLWLFISQYKNPILWKGTLLGVVFGVCFVTRVEGILFLAAIPAAQVLIVILRGRIQGQIIKNIMIWCLLYVVGAAAVAVPHVIMVSETMGVFALNGRQVWSAYLPKGGYTQEYYRKKNGLDHDPGLINIEYAKTHPEVWTSNNLVADPTKIEQLLKHIVGQFGAFLRYRLVTLLGPVGLFLFGIGLLWFFRSGKVSEGVATVGFLSLALAAPIFHNVDMRHLMPIAPMMFLVVGLGTGYLIQVVCENSMIRFKSRGVVAAVMVGIIVIPWIYPVYAVSAKPPVYNKGYGPKELQEPSEIIRKLAQTELNRRPTILAQRTYLARFVDGIGVEMPYADYQQFLRYCELNHVDFVYLQHRLVRKGRYAPFYDHFLTETGHSEFERIYSGEDAFGDLVELYRFRGPEHIEKTSYLRSDS